MLTRLIVTLWHRTIPFVLVAASVVACGPPAKDVTLIIAMDGRGLGVTDGKPNRHDTVFNGVQMAIDEEGGPLSINGKRIKSVTLQRRELECNAPAGTAEADWVKAYAQAAADDPAVIAFLGTLCGGANMQLELPITNQGNLLQAAQQADVGLSRAVPGVADVPQKYYPTGERTFARLVPANDVVAVLDVQEMKTLGATRVYVFHDDAQPGKTEAVFVRDLLVPNALTLAKFRSEPAASITTTLAAQIATDVESSTANLVFLGVGLKTAPTLVKAIRANAGTATTKIMMGNVVSQNTGIPGQIGAPANIEMYGVSNILPSDFTAKLSTWYDAYRATYDPTNWGVFVPHYYDATKMLIAAIKAAGDSADDRVTIRKNFLATKDYDGVLGKWSFDDNGETTLRALAIVKVVNLKWQVTKVVQ